MIRDNRSFLVIAVLSSLALLLVGMTEFAVGRPNEVATDAEPQIAPPPGQYTKDIFVNLSTADGESQIIYTLDGSLPLPGRSFAFTDPIRLASMPPQMVSIRYRVVHPDGSLGSVHTAAYFLHDNSMNITVPAISIVMAPTDLYGEQGLITNFEERGQDWERPVHLTYFAPDSIQPGFVINAGLRIHGNASRYTPKKSFRLYFRREYGQAYLDYPLFSDSPTSRYKRLILRANSQETVFARENWTLLRDALAYELGRSVMEDVVPYSRPAILFVNGEMYGVYHLTERVDDWFFATRHGLEDVDFLDLPEQTFRLMDNPESRIHWDHLLNFVETHDLAAPEHYAYVSTQLDIDQYIDYHIIQVYYTNSDWPHANVLQFRPRVQGGRWRWVLWDLQYGFGLAPGSAVDYDMIGWILQKEHPYMTGRATMLLHKLLENPQFRSRFLTRLADLLNTRLASESVVSQLDQLAAELAPVIPFEIGRWSQGDTGTWLANIEDMRTFAQDRPSYVREHVARHFSASRHQLSLTLPSPDGGLILINGIPLEANSTVLWQGEYFNGNRVELVAIPSAGYRFSGWGTAWPSSARLSLTVEGDYALAPVFAPATAALEPGDVTIGYSSNQILLRVNRANGVDLRGWRLTDNDSPTAHDEGSITFAQADVWHQVRPGTAILIDLTTPATADELDGSNGQIEVGMSSPYLKFGSGPGLILGDVDNLALLDSSGKPIDLITIGSAREYWRLAAAFALLPNQFQEARDR